MILTEEAEAEVVALSMTARAVNSGVAIHAEVITGDSDRFHGELVYIEEFDCGIVYTDNEAARLAVIRGFSSKMSHLNKTYGVALGWTHQRIERGELDLLGEDTKDMMADPLTKVMPATVLEERGVLGRHLGKL